MEYCVSYTPVFNKVSALNESTTPLASLATYTGTAEDATAYDAVVVTVLTDQAGTLYVDFSPNGTSWDSSLTFSVSASVPETHRLTVSRRYYRVRLTNTAASAQTLLRLQCLMGGYTGLTAPLNLSVQQDADALLVKTVDTETLLAAGQFTGISIVNKFGVNNDVDTGSIPEDMWRGGGIYPGFPLTTLETVSVSSASANDAAAGTGARTVLITGLNGDYAVQSETVTLNGVTPVASVNTFRRVHTARDVTAGSGGVNAGIITATHTTTTANIFFAMPVGFNQTQVGGYTVPAGYTAYLRHIEAGILGTTSNSASIALWIRQFGDAARMRRPFGCGVGFFYSSNIYGGLSLPEKTDIIPRVTAVTANNTDLFCSYDLVLVKN